MKTVLEEGLEKQAKIENDPKSYLPPVRGFKNASVVNNGSWTIGDSGWASFFSKKSLSKIWRTE